MKDRPIEIKELVGIALGYIIYAIGVYLDYNFFGRVLAGNRLQAGMIESNFQIKTLFELLRMAGWGLMTISLLHIVLRRTNNLIDRALEIPLGIIKILGEMIDNSKKGKNG